MQDRPATTGATDAWHLPAPPRQMAGFAFGLAYPALFVAVRMPPTTAAERSALAARLRALCPPALAGQLADTALEPMLDLAQAERPLLETAQWFAALASAFATAAGLPVVQPARVLRVDHAVCTLAVPMLLRGLAPLAGLVASACASFAGPPVAPPNADRIAALFNALAAANLTTSNTPRLVRAAVEHGIPWQEVPGTAVVQYGLGRRSVLLDSTFTQFTPNIGARFARNKHEAAAMLRRHRLPVPDHVLVTDEAQALDAARRLGFPLVVKPADCDGGLAVRADLRDESEVKDAFAVARKASARVLVERFVAGRDYRLTVFRGRCIWAVERQPAAVTGNGADSIAALVDQANADPRRGEGPHAPLKRLKLDDEALGLLRRDGLTPDSVPAAGRFVRLRRAANISSGGMPVAVHDQVHPDNARLAARAARALKLDLAGVDLLIPDIAASWKETGAAICEVNGQPELGGVTGPHLYPLILRSLTGGDGRIPTFAILGGPMAEDLGAAVAEALQARGFVPGLHGRQGIAIGDTWLERGPVPQLAAGQLLAGNAAVGALVFCATNAGTIAHGFPVPCIDLLIVTGESLEPPLGSASDPAAAGSPVQVLQVLAGLARQVVRVDSAAGADGAWDAAFKALSIDAPACDVPGIAALVELVCDGYRA